MSAPTWEIREGDALASLRAIPSGAVHCVVTSPPYWGLRDYGAEGQLGLEPTPQAYVRAMVDVFEEVRRVLRPDGTCWLNLGDTYASAGGPGWQGKNGQRADRRYTAEGRARNALPGAGLKPKDLAMIPARVAIALQEAGWYLRSEVVWHKPNPMPESVRDRPTKAHEMVYLLTPSERYFYDPEAVAEPATGRASGRKGEDKAGSGPGFEIRSGFAKSGSKEWHTRNRRSVWTIASRPFPGAHFATFPPELPETCIRAGTSERGACATCGAPWERVVERETVNRSNAAQAGTVDLEGKGHPSSQVREGHDVRLGPTSRTTTTGWAPTCDHGGEPVPCLVLDPFSGAGTTGLVALRLGRSFLGLELSPTYAAMSRARITADSPLLNGTSR